MKLGDLYRHTKRPEWGVGVVAKAAGADVWDVFFEGHGRVRLQEAVAKKLLEAVDPSDLPVGSALGDSARWPEFEPPPSQRRVRLTGTTLCDRCARKLRQSQYSADRQWKSCPSCSVRDGVVHIFHQYPQAFGQSEARENDETPDGAQSWCQACRTGELPGDRARRCQDVS